MARMPPKLLTLQRLRVPKPLKHLSPLSEVRRAFKLTSWDVAELITSGLVDIALILGGDFFTGAVLAAALTKLVLRFEEFTSDKTKANALRAEVSERVRFSSSVDVM